MSSRAKLLHAAVRAAIVTLLAFSADVRAQNEIVYNENFQSYATQASPTGWVDNVVGQLSVRRRAVNAPGGSMNRTWTDPLQERNVVYGTREAAGDARGEGARFGTFSTLTSMGFAQTLDYSGRFLRTSNDTRVGISFFSSYPEKDRYYLIALSPQTMQLFSYGAGVLAGTIDSGFAPEPNVWYRFRVVVDAQSRETSIRARFWRDGSEEPAGDSIIATDADSKRLIAGRIGMWSAVGGGAYVDDLIARSSQPSGPIDSKPPNIAFYESGTRIDPSSSPTFVRDVAIEIRVEDESPFTVTSILDGSPYTSLATITTEGTHSLRVIAVDAYGNRSESTLTFTIRRATSGPAIAFTSPSSSQILGAAHIIATGTFDNATSVSVNGIAAQIDAAARTFTVSLDLLEGPNTLTAVATDAASNTATASLPLVVDTRGPELSVTSPASNACIDAVSIEVRGRAIDPALKSVKVMSLDATVAADGTWSVIVPAPNESTYTMTIEA
ncbi:MAG TPA: hypothetical protein VGS96_10420, partial [Thermoanaerobaculia bacterium]|nr:hypothetical protein [Thermoanaerobaculia bacterium]